MPICPTLIHLAFQELMHCCALEPDLPNHKSQAQYSLPGCILTNKPQNTDGITRTKPLLYKPKLIESHVTGQPQNCEVSTHRTTFQKEPHFTSFKFIIIHSVFLQFYGSGIQSIIMLKSHLKQFTENIQITDDNKPHRFLHGGIYLK